MSPTAISATSSSFFFFNDTATTEIYTLSLHDALPIYHAVELSDGDSLLEAATGNCVRQHLRDQAGRSEEHTSELQSRLHLVCRLLLEKKNAPNQGPGRRRAYLPYTDAIAASQDVTNSS